MRKLPSLKMPSLKRAELDAKLTSALAKRHFGLRDLAERERGGRDPQGLYQRAGFCRYFQSFPLL